MKKKSKFSFDALFGNKRFSAVFSLVAAIFIWLIVITIINPDTTKQIAVPVDFDYNSTAYTSQGLDIIVRPSKSVIVTVSGDGSVLGGLTASDILIYPDYSGVKEAGTYNLKLEIKKADSTKRYDILSPVQQTMEITLDKVLTQKYTVVVNASGIQPAKGYYMDLATASPAEVTLTGPANQMNRVDKVVANVELGEERTESAIVTAKLAYLDKNGNPIEDSNIMADSDQIEVTIPILKIRELPLKVEFTGVPTGYDPEQLGAQLSEQTIRIAGPASQVDALESITAGYIDLSQFKLGEPLTLPITLPDGLRSVDNLQEAVVTFDTTGYASKTVTVTELRTINVPAGVTVTYPTERVNNVTLIGKQSELEALTANSVIAQIDASAGNISVSRGQQNMPVQILVPSSQSVFATGTYTVLAEITTEAAGAAASTSENAAG